jgi:hypothetical protein
LNYEFIKIAARNYKWFGNIAFRNKAIGNGGD